MKIIVPSEKDYERVGGKMLANALKNQAIAYSACRSGCCSPRGGGAPGGCGGTGAKCKRM